MIVDPDDLYMVFIEGWEAPALINGEALAREVFGREISTSAPGTVGFMFRCIFYSQALHPLDEPQYLM